MRAFLLCDLRAATLFDEALDGIGIERLIVTHASYLEADDLVPLFRYLTPSRNWALALHCPEPNTPASSKVPIRQRLNL